MCMLQNGRGPVEPINARSMLDAAATAAMTATADRPPVERRRRLTPAAIAVSNQKVGRAYSPIVIAGVVRVIDFAMLSAIGIALYFGYVVPLSRLLLGISRGDLRRGRNGRDLLPGRRYLPGAAIPRPSSPDDPDGFILGVRIPAVHRRILHRQARQRNFAALAHGVFLQSALRRWSTERLFLRSLVRSWARQGRLDRRTIIVGADENGEQLVQALKTQDDSDIKVLGVFDDRNDDRALDTCAGSPKLGKVDDIVEFARRTRIDLVLFALPISAETRILEMLKKLWVLPVDIRLSAHTNKLRFRPRSYSYLGEVPTLDVFEAPITDWDLVMKWLFDHVVGFVILVLALPVMGLVALAVKLDSPGPVLFRQKRFGFNNERIDVFKFRSMYHHQADPTASKVVTKNDPRVTRVGRFIRKTSLDELPQLFNVVFKSNLSLVGPRPHAVQGKLQNRLFDEAVDGYFARHRVKPGITGWAQINGWRGEIDTDEKIQKRVEFDLYYIENWSVLFDLYILLKTPLALLTKNENAY